MYFSNSVWAMWLPALAVYLLIPLADMVFGEDLNNPPEIVVPQLEADPYYRWASYALVPVLWSAFLRNAYFVGTVALVWYGVLAIAERLGYRDTSNLGRTCKRWFGLSPREIRKGRAVAGSSEERR